MKRLILFLSIILLFVKVYSQDGVISFDNFTNLFRIKIDTSNPNNNWQIGKPDKQFFQSAYSQPNDIITDSINPYPINNNSIFLLGFSIPYYPYASDVTYLGFYYKIDSDTINDFGKIEFSADTGNTYYNLLNYSHYSIYDSSGNLVANNGSGNPIVFTGKSYGWYHCVFSTWGIPSPDSLIYRFSFQSDGIQNNRDGWMIDNIAWLTIWEGIPASSSKCLLFPNPAKEYIELDCNTKVGEYQILSEFGQILLSSPIKSMPIIINIKYLKEGIYFLKIIQEDKIQIIRKFIKTE